MTLLKCTLQLGQRVLRRQRTHVHRSAGQGLSFMLHLLTSFIKDIVHQPDRSFLTLFLLFLIVDTVHFTRRGLQYCHPSIICERESHEYAFASWCDAVKYCVLCASRSFGFIFFSVLLFVRENKIYCRADHRPGNLDWCIYSRTPSADQLHFTRKLTCASVRHRVLLSPTCSCYTYTNSLCVTVWREEQRSFALSSDCVSESRTQVSCSMFPW